MSALQALLPPLMGLRQALGQHGELSGQEAETRRLLREFLARHTSLEVYDLSGGLVAAHREPQGPCIAFRGDMAIMRSMGIRVRVIRLGMYVRMLLALLPAYVLVVLAANICYRSPLLSKYLSLYLYPWQYALLFVGMLLLTLRVTHKQIRRLFGQSVKKSLKGGTAE